MPNQSIREQAILKIPNIFIYVLYFSIKINNSHLIFNPYLSNVFIYIFLNEFEYFAHI